MRSSSLLFSFIFISGFLETSCDNIWETKDSITTDEPESVKLLYGESHGIYWTDLSLTDRLPPLLTCKYLDVLSIDYHYMKNLIFYTAKGAVWRLAMDGVAGEVRGERVVGEGAAAVAVDWERDILYFTSPGARRVTATDLKGVDRDVIIHDTGELTRHNNLVVDPYMRYLFLATDAGHSLRADLGGDHVVRLSHGLRGTSVAVDVHSRRLFVCGSRDFTPVLLSTNYDGGHTVEYRLDNGAEGWVQLVSVGVFGSQVFWVHHGWRERDTAWRANITDGAEHLTWQKEYTPSGTALDPESRIWCLKVYHPDVQTPPKYFDSRKSQSSSDQVVGDRTSTDADSGASTSLCSKHFVSYQILIYLLLAIFRQKRL